MNQVEQMASLESEKHFEVVLKNKPKVVINGDVLETHGLFACVAIAGFFEGEQNTAFMTHRGVQDVVQNLTDVIEIADQNKLRKLLGTVFIFRQDESIMPRNHYIVDGVKYDYQGLIERIKGALLYTFPRARIIEVRYGKESTAETGDAILDLRNRKYKTDIEEGEF